MKPWYIDTIPHETAETRELQAEELAYLKEVSALIRAGYHNGPEPEEGQR